MAGNSNELIVKVLGDTKQLTRDLAGAESQLKGFASTSSTIHSRMADGLRAETKAARERGQAYVASNAAAEESTKRLEEADRVAAAKRRRNALLLGIGVNALGRNLAETGGEAGRFGSALSSLTTGNFVGFYKAARDNKDAIKAFTAELIASGDVAKSVAQANLFAAQGFDAVAKAARAATTELLANQAAQSRVAASPGEGNLAGSNEGFQAFRGTPFPKPRPGISATQRNTFFDNDLTRSLDRVRDADLRGQVTKLKEIAATIQERIAVTKDITRKENLEDELAGVVRQRRGVEETLAKNALDRAAAAKRAAEALRKAREAREKALAEARLAAIQAKQFRTIGLAADGSDVVPGVDNLKKQLESLTERLGGSSVKLSSKLQSQLAGVRKLFSGDFEKITRASREGVAGIFDAIRDEFDKGAKGPLTKTSGLDTKKFTAGLGLSADQIRELRGRASGLNSAGLALSGGPVSRGGGFVGGRNIVVESHVTVQADGHTIGKVVTRSQQKSKRRNPAQRRGPNRFD